jgi:copper(I)-binding protein
MLCLSKRGSLAAALVTLCVPAFAHDGVHIHDPYARILNGAGAVYFLIDNRADTPDVLIAASSPDAGMVHLMNSSADANGVMKMREVQGGFALQATATRILSGGGDHVMLMGVPGNYTNGQTVTLTLTFEQAGAVTLTVPVDNARTSAPTTGPTQFDAQTAAIDRAATPETGAMSVASGTDDQTAIIDVMKAQFDRPDAPLTVNPVVVMGDDAVASWAQGEMGGRALLARRHGVWAIVLCGGPDLRTAEFLAANGVRDAVSLSQMFNTAEDGLGAAHVALSSKFPEVVLMSAHAHN